MLDTNIINFSTEKLFWWIEPWLAVMKSDLVA